jgi:hypothetical protein
MPAKLVAGELITDMELRYARRGMESTSISEA